MPCFVLEVWQNNTHRAHRKRTVMVDVHYFEKREDMTNELLSYVKEGDTILIKASHFMEFPKVVEALQA